ncbi:DUF4233 domain-containing protein [Nakamurella silvestris]|nr:DUF4233 domain-containing protein [Nakamurella silvestris]
MTDHPADLPAPEGSAESVPPVRTRPADPERGIRGAMSATLILEAITVLLALPVVSQAGSLTGLALGIILAITVALIYACSIVKKRWALPFIIGLQVAIIGCWLIHPAIGVMGIIFGLVWWTLIYFRTEYRRRLHEGSLPRR